ncbi:hypothetical protein A6R68_17584, partial [Neotoma lepida]
MFDHAYGNYMHVVKRSYCAHRSHLKLLQLLVATGRVRGQEPSRGDVDDALGKFSLTLIDSLDTLVEYARKALDFLWEKRQRSSNLVGVTINIHTGDWVRKDSGVGAGIDSYYEYLLKAYVLLGDD